MIFLLLKLTLAVGAKVNVPVELIVTPVPTITLVLMLPPVTLPVVDINPLDVNEVKVPTEVIFGCALVVTVAAVPTALPADTAYVALATVPVTLAPVIFVNALPLPIM